MGSRRLEVEGPAISSWGELVRARAPIVTEDGRMLGWLALDFGASQWFASQVQARLLTFVVLGLGVLIALLRLRQRLRAAESEAAQRRAEAAAAADRAKTAFLAKVSHELRTPIQGILGYSELLRGAGLPEEQLRRVEAVHGQGEL